MINAFKLELLEIKNSFYLFSLLTWIPLVSFLLIIAIFNKGVVRDLHITVVDHDNSKLSRKIIMQIDANSALHVKGIQANLKQAGIDISSGNIYATVVIPKYFEKDVLQKKQPQITAFINTQYLLIGKMINSALSSTIQQSSARVEFVSNLRKDGQFSTAENLASPISIQVTPFFNTYQNYFLFLVTAIIPTLLQVLIALALIASIGKTFKEKKEKEFFKNGIVGALIGKTLPYTLAFLGWGVMFLLYMYGYETWEFQGSFGVTFLALLLMILAYEGIALSFFVISFDSVRALSLAALYTAPAFAFLGITFPVSSMPEFAVVWHNLLPISHYLKIQISQASYGAPVSEIVPLLLNLICFLPMWIFVILKLRKKV